MGVNEPGNTNKPYKHTPSGVTGSLDTTQSFPGSMMNLVNLVPSIDTNGQWVGRPPATLLPGSQILTDITAGITGKGIITAMIVYGRLAVGMAVSYNRSGQDEPFVYDLVQQKYIAIAGITFANTPLSFLNPALTAWYNYISPGAVLPSISMCGIGAKVIICHPGYNANAGGSGTLLFGYIDFTLPNAPVYDSTNTTVNALPYQPQVVVNFNQRAYYFMNPPVSTGGIPAVMASDVLQPLIATNGGYSITFGDNLPLTAGGALPLTNQLGGVAQSLIVFKGYQNVFQITGDFALNNVFVNSLNIATGTLSPLSVTPTPFGLTFLSPDGIRMITFAGQVTPPLGTQGKGVVVPFIKSANLGSIICASNGASLRVCGIDQNSNPFDYYYDFDLQQWHGPHTFPASLGMGVYGSSYIFATNNGAAGIWSENILNVPAASYTEGASTNAVQSFFLFADPAANDTVNINGVSIKFVTGAPGAYQVHRGGGAATTAGLLYTFLNGSLDATISQCNYFNFAALPLPGVGVQFKTAGPAGNSFYIGSGSSVVGIMAAGLPSGPGAPITAVLEGGQSTVALTFDFTTTLLPLRDDIRECANVISVIYGAELDGIVWTVTANDQVGTALNSVTITPRSVLSANQVPWTIPLVFDKLSIDISGTLSATTRIGDWYMEYQTLGYIPIGYPY